MAPDITIRNECNESKETISLIPFSRPNGVDLESKFVVTKKLAKNIPAGESKKVELKYYDRSDTGPDSQIYMLFRAGEFPKSVTPRKNELFLYSDLAKKTEWKLSLDGNRQVIGGPKNAAGQTSSGANADGRQDETQLEKLKKQVQELQVMVEDLAKKVKDLKTALARL